MSLLLSVLHAIQAAGGPVTLNELSQQLEIEPGALEGIIAFWVRKGRLTTSGGVAASCGPAACSACAPTDADGCPFVIGTATRWELGD
jgi:hypothetical protein